MSATTGDRTNAATATVDLHARPAAPRTAALLTVDVEDWFHVNYRSFRPPAGPPALRRVEPNTDRLLELCARRGDRGTFFVLGCVAQDHPGLVRRIAAAGHEVACHGLAHELLYEQGEARFRSDVGDARARLQDLSGQSVLGFRAPSWSLTRRSLWALDALVELGFRYDASLFAVENYMYGLREAPPAPAFVRTLGGATLFEVPAPALRVGPLAIPHGGGFYLRMLPLWFERLAMRLHARRGEPSMLYVHPREVDEVEIAMPLGALESFIQSARVAAGRRKLLRLLTEHTWQPIADVYADEIAAPVV
ncbi:polysaccharide deacetylase family protein [Candidatus Binatia bacterium]|nr:polysaccharide deacetylase family protein [Candidatus Binatia bacterium]